MLKIKNLKVNTETEISILKGLNLDVNEEKYMQSWGQMDREKAPWHQ